MIIDTDEEIEVCGLEKSNDPRDEGFIEAVEQDIQFLCTELQVPWPIAKAICCPQPGIMFELGLRCGTRFEFQQVLTSRVSSHEKYVILVLKGTAVHIKPSEISWVREAPIQALR